MLLFVALCATAAFIAAVMKWASRTPDFPGTERTVIVWLANGLSPTRPSELDAFSRASFSEAMRQYNAAKDRGCEVSFLVPNSIVEDGYATVLRDVMLWQAQKAVPEARLTERKTVGGPTDCLAIADEAGSAKALRVVLCCTTHATSLYFGAMFRATGWYFRGYAVPVDCVVAAAAPRPRLSFRALYTALWAVTKVAATNERMFFWWWKFLTHRQEGRRKGFTRTVS